MQHISEYFHSKSIVYRIEDFDLLLHIEQQRSTNISYVSCPWPFRYTPLIFQYGFQCLFDAQMIYLETRDIINEQYFVSLLNHLAYVELTNHMVINSWFIFLHEYIDDYQCPQVQQALIYILAMLTIYGHILQTEIDASSDLLWGMIESTLEMNTIYEDKVIAACLYAYVILSQFDNRILTDRVKSNLLVLWQNSSSSLIASAARAAYLLMILP